MYAISLTSIPPRFKRLGPVLDSLLRQDPAPARVLLCLPRSYRRFPAPFDPPALPDGVEIIRREKDLGPATKVLAAAGALKGSVDRLIYCDDDWLMPPGWAATLLEAQTPGEAVAATGYGVSRLGRVSNTKPPHTDIAQGFSGVLVDPAWLADPAIDPPEAAWSVDDIWLSGQLARQGVPIRLVPEARQGQRLAFQDTHALQDATVAGQTRRQANLACIGLLTEKFGLWPAR